MIDRPLVPVTQALVDRAALHQIVYFDMDGVLTNFNKAVLCGIFDLPDHKLEAVYRAAQQKRIGSVSLYLEKQGISRNEMWRRINASESFWESMEPMADACELWHALQNRGCETYILTSPSYEPSSASGKMRWLRKHLRVATRDDNRFIITGLKHLLARPGSLLIDDTEKKTAKFKAWGGHAWLWPEAGYVESRMPVRDI